MKNAQEVLIGTESVLRFTMQSAASDRHADAGTANAHTVRIPSEYHIEDARGGSSASPTIPSTWATILKNGNRMSPASRRAAEQRLRPPG